MVGAPRAPCAHREDRRCGSIFRSYRHELFLHSHYFRPASSFPLAKIGAEAPGIFAMLGRETPADFVDLGDGVVGCGCRCGFRVHLSASRS